jgi:hypothetical protein
MNQNGTGADFREVSNLACLVTTALLYPALLVIAFLSPAPVSWIGLLIAGVALQTVVLIVVHALAALFTRAEPDDERVAAIAHRSDRISGVVLGVGVVLVIGLTVVQGLADPERAGTFASPIFTGYVLLACFVVSELIRMTHAAILYRRG